MTVLTYSRRYLWLELRGDIADSGTQQQSDHIIILTVLQCFVWFRLVEHEVALHTCHAHPLPLPHYTRCKLLRAGQWLVWVEPLEHLLDLVLRGVVYPHLHVHTTRPNQGRIQPAEGIILKIVTNTAMIGTSPGSWWS